MKLCKHSRYKVIDWIKEPKYSSDEILINTNAIDSNIEHYLIKFTNCNQYKDWFYMSGKSVRRYHTQRNGNGIVYVVPMSTRQTFEPLQHCEHEL